ncbi:PIG-L deacetylase family protein [Tengunoibacter tsumagoiensis]|nr:PIG-L family deacetylase [Tengunoibacter tsumagoiensis]
MEKSLLLCLAHPDDEAGCAPLVARYIAEGARATLICATNGEVGTVDEKFLTNYSSIAELRLAELQCATQVAGYTDVVTFGYRDSGMMGAKENLESSCLWQAPLEEVTDRIIEVIHRVRPQVLITFNTYGMYGHPDHIKINQATHAAFERLQGEPDAPQKLYYINISISKFHMKLFLTAMKIMGKDPRKVGVNADIDLIAAMESLTPITTKIPTGYYRARGWQASDCYPSQFQTSRFQRITRRLFGRWTEAYSALSRIIPEHQIGETIEKDLFE